MCTAATYKTKDFYFGRTLDYEFSYGDQITVTPRNYPFRFRHAGEMNTHYGIIGMAHVAADYPLYYDAINEKGVGIAGLNFVGNAVYAEVQDGKENVAQFELIPWILGQCASMKEVHELLDRINIVNTPFSPQFPLALLINREDAVRWQRVNMRLPCIHPAAMPRKVFITTIPMKTTRSVEWTCTEKTLTVTN